jgi:hypothetical protein
MGSFVGAHASATTTSVTTLTGVSWTGLGVQSGDIAILAWTFSTTGIATAPSGFTSVGSTDDGTCRSRVYKRVCTGSESGDVSLVNDTAQRQSAVLYVVRGYTGVSGFKSLAETGTSTSHACPQITTADGAVNGDAVIVVASERLTSGTVNATAPTGFVEHTTSEFGTGGTGGAYTGVADDGLVTAQTFPLTPAAWTGFVSGDTAVTWTLSLTPSSSPVNAYDGRGLKYHMNRKAGTLVNDQPTIEADLAANIWAGTTGRPLVGALNVKAGNTFPQWKELQGVLNQLAGTSGLAIDGAAASIP